MEAYWSLLLRGSAYTFISALSAAFGGCAPKRDKQAQSRGEDTPVRTLGQKRNGDIL